MFNDKVKKNATKTIAFLIILLVIFLTLNSVWFNVNLKYTQFGITDYQFEKYKDETRILFLGDSHTKDNINPHFINDSFNFAIRGEKYIMTYYKFKSILDNEDLNIDIISLPIDLHSFSIGKDHWDVFDLGLWYWGKYVNFYDIVNIRNEVNLLTLIDWEINYLFPFIGQGEQIFHFNSLNEIDRMKQLSSYEIICGFYKTEFDLDQIEYDTFKNDVERNIDNDFKYTVFDNDLYNYFLKCVDLARENDIKVILIKSPLTIEYFNATKMYINSTDFYDKILDEISNFNNVYILDYQKTFFNNITLFKDPDHLNKIGAERLSKMVNNDLMQLGLIS